MRMAPVQGVNVHGSGMDVYGFGMVVWDFEANVHNCQMVV
ncbi:hypothetical protein Uis4E_1753 [Bifidobacterium parmae]|uniref:Uncharacterized protein n=1 Tax=Bifidobacterium parmae TaxID=361854 RepID=A0A2N5IYY2_9BIFI|nr:hypothetical protein Uis4E_1753 [Bifidobacterium parmae]